VETLGTPQAMALQSKKRTKWLHFARREMGLKALPTGQRGAVSDRRTLELVHLSSRIARKRHFGLSDKLQCLKRLKKSPVCLMLFSLQKDEVLERRSDPLNVQYRDGLPPVPGCRRSLCAG
jgi:hypothetical protein